MDALIALSATILGTIFVGVVVAVVICFGITLYILPALIANSRGHSHTPLILLVNVLLGWSFIPWMFCFCWAWTGSGGR